MIYLIVGGGGVKTIEAFVERLGITPAILHIGQPDSLVSYIKKAVESSKPISLVDYGGKFVKESKANDCILIYFTDADILSIPEGRTTSSEVAPIIEVALALNLDIEVRENTPVLNRHEWPSYWPTLKHITE